MRVLVTGANGFIGGYIVSALLDAGHQVVGAVRDTDALRARFPDLDALECDLNRDTSIDAWLPRLAGIDAVVNCAGVLQDSPYDSTIGVHARGAAALFTACERAGVRRVVHLSAIGVDRDAPTAFSHSKFEGDKALMARDLDWVILRPSVVVGRPAYGGSALFRGLAALRRDPKLREVDCRACGHAQHDAGQNERSRPTARATERHSRVPPCRP